MSMQRRRYAAVGLSGAAAVINHYGRNYIGRMRDSAVRRGMDYGQRVLGNVVSGAKRKFSQLSKGPAQLSGPLGAPVLGASVSKRRKGGRRRVNKKGTRFKKAVRSVIASSMEHKVIRKQSSFAVTSSTLLYDPRFRAYLIPNNKCCFIPIWSQSGSTGYGLDVLFPTKATGTGMLDHIGNELFVKGMKFEFMVTQQLDTVATNDSWFVGFKLVQRTAAKVPPTSSTPAMDNFVNPITGRTDASVMGNADVTIGHYSAQNDSGYISAHPRLPDITGNPFPSSANMPQAADLIMSGSRQKGWTVLKEGLLVKPQDLYVTRGSGQAQYQSIVRQLYVPINKKFNYAKLTANDSIQEKALVYLMLWAYNPNTAYGDVATVPQVNISAYTYFRD